MITTEMVKIWTHADKLEHEWMTKVIRTDYLSPQKELVGRRHDVMHKKYCCVHAYYAVLHNRLLRGLLHSIMIQEKKREKVLDKILHPIQIANH